MTSPARVHWSRRQTHAWASLRDLTGACAGHSGFAEGFQTSRFGPSSGALSLSTVYSAFGLAGLLHPAAMFRTPPVQGLLSPCSGALSSTASCPLTFRSVRAHRLPGCHTYEPRFRGFSPHEAALHSQSGEPRKCPLPSSVSCSSRCSVSRWPVRFPRAVPLLAFHPRETTSGLLEAAAFSVFTTASPTLCRQSADLHELFGPPIPRSLERFFG